jgi:hypothetical protein
MIDVIDNVISKAAVIYELAKRAGNLELQQKIADLQEELIKARTAYYDAQNENLNLRKEALALQETVSKLKKAATGDIEFCTTAYFVKDSDAPFCSCCFDADNLLIHLVPTTGTTPASVYKCPRCKNIYRLY